MTEKYRVAISVVGGASWVEDWHYSNRVEQLASLLSHMAINGTTEQIVWVHKIYDWDEAPRATKAKSVQLVPGFAAEKGKLVARSYAFQARSLLA